MGVMGEARSGLAMSLTAQFDQLVRNRAVLASGEGEQAFLGFVRGAAVTRGRWEAAEVECQRLAIELTRSDQEVSLLAARLEAARGMLEQEGEARRRAEQDRELLAGKLSAVQQLVMGGAGGRQGLTQQMSRILATPEAAIFPTIHLGDTRVNRTQGSEVVTVEDLMSSFDDTLELCRD